MITESQICELEDALVTLLMFFVIVLTFDMAANNVEKNLYMGEDHNAPIHS